MCLRIISMAILLQLLKQAESACSSDIVQLNATRTPQTISSANYPHGYSQSQNCRWLLTANNKVDVVRIRVLDSAIDDHATCGNDYVEARDGEYSWSRQIKRWCGNGVPDPEEYTSSEGKLLLIFKTDATDDTEPYRIEGFKLEFFSVPKAGTEYADVELKAMNYVLFIVFAVLVSSIIVTAIIIAVIRTHHKKQKAKEPPRSPRMFQSQKERLKKEMKNGKPKSGLKKTKVGDVSTIADSHTLLYSSTSTLTTPV